MFIMRNLVGLHQHWATILKYVCMEFVKKVELSNVHLNKPIMMERYNGKNPSVVICFPLLQKKENMASHEKMNYEPRQRLCNPACVLGKKLQVPTYEFLKEAVIRKYGEEFYEALDKIARKRSKRK